MVPGDRCCPTATSRTAPSRGRIPDLDDAAARSRSVPHRSERLLRVPARPERTLARPWVDPRHAGPRAPHRRHREGRRHRQHLLRPGEPREQCAAARREGRAHRPGHPAELESTARRRGDVLVVGWGGTYGALRQRSSSAQTAGKKVATRTCAGSSRSDRTSAKIMREFKHVLVAELNMGQLVRVLRAEVPDRRDRPQQDPGPAVQGPTKCYEAIDQLSSGASHRPPARPEPMSKRRS